MFAMDNIIRRAVQAAVTILIPGKSKQLEEVSVFYEKVSVHISKSYGDWNSLGI